MTEYEEEMRCYQITDLINRGEVELAKQVVREVEAGGFTEGMQDH